MSVDIETAPTIEAMIRAGAEMLQASQSPRLDARVLAKLVLQCSDAELISRAADAPDNNLKEKFFALVDRRAGGEPVAYITGVKEFWGMPFRVTRDVLIPRADSECLIETVCEQSVDAGPLRILDLGTGSGCLLCALLRELPNATGVGVDVSPAAVAVANDNAEALGLAARAEFLVSDWLDNVEGAFDIIVANAPYIPDGRRSGLSIDVSEFEPAAALFGGEDGLDPYRRILQDVPTHIQSGGLIVAEYGDAGQGERFRAIAAGRLPGARISVIRDLAARERGVAIRLGPGKRD